MKRTPMPPRRTLLARSPIKRKARKPSEFARVYHSRARVEWIKSLPCVITGEYGDIENAHVKNGGMGRKADYIWIVPMKRRVHALYHKVGQLTLQEQHDIDLELAAIATEQAWLAHCARMR